MLSGANPRPSESGQALAVAVLALGIFLLGGLGFAVDIASLWFHRQTAQNAADAACTAGAMDLYLDAEGGATGNQGFTPGTAFDCSSSPAAVPCEYASFNGYNGANSSPGNDVSVSFPGSVPGVTAPPASLISTPFIRVDVIDHVKVFFSGLLSGNQTQDVRAFAVCGVVLSQSPVPIVVLNPAASGSLNDQGTVTVYGGPSKGIQVNSNSATAISLGSGKIINLSEGGSALTGSNLGVFGGPSASPGGFSGGTTGSWVAPASPVGDPFAQLATPAQPPNPQIPADQTKCKKIPCKVNYHDPVHGCPDSSGCELYTPGYYPSGIAIKNKTAIFDPGLYYLDGSLQLENKAAVRPSTAAGDGSGGTTFYFKGTNTITVTKTSGSSSLDPFTVSLVKCTPSSQLPANLPATFQGDVLLAPCSGTYGDPLGTGDPAGEQRGLLFFQDRSAAASPSWGGSAQFLLAGALYFHQCNSSGTGVNCSSSDYDTVLSVSETSGLIDYILGSVIADQLSVGGSSVTTDLGASPAYLLPKAALLE